MNLSFERDRAGSSGVPARSTSNRQDFVFREFARRFAWNRSECHNSVTEQHIAPVRYEDIETGRIELDEWCRWFL